MNESRTIEIDKENLEYVLIRRKMKTIRLRITGEGKLVASCPMRTSAVEVERAIINNKDWVKSAIFRDKSV